MVNTLTEAMRSNLTERIVIENIKTTSMLVRALYLHFCQVTRFFLTSKV